MMPATVMRALVERVPEYVPHYPLTQVVSPFATLLAKWIDEDPGGDVVRRSLRYVEELAAGGERHGVQLVTACVLDAVTLERVPLEWVGPMTYDLARGGRGRWEREDVDPADVHERLLAEVPELGPLFAFSRVTDDLDGFLRDRVDDEDLVRRAFAYVEEVGRDGPRDAFLMLLWSLFADAPAWPEWVMREAVGPGTRKALEELDVSGPLPLRLHDEEL